MLKKLKAYKYHTPVMINEVLLGLVAGKGKKFIDATLGGGGHAAHIIAKGSMVLGIDKDEEAVKYSKALLKDAISEKKIIIKKSSYSNLYNLTQETGFERADGILFDLGLSSHQLDKKSRGFGIKHKESLIDMRFDLKQEIKALDIINSYSREKLYGIFSEYSEEKRSWAIANAVFSARKVKPILYIGDLTSVIEKCVEKKVLTKVLSRIFQALRIETNQELEELKKGLLQAEKILKKNGRLVVISYHSLEDRIVKRTMKKKVYEMVTKKPVLPDKNEILENSRAKSAKLRIAVKR